MNDREKIGVIGVGAIGSCFVRRILAHDLKAVAYDTNAAALKSLAVANVEIAESAADLASKCNVIVTCVTDPAAVEAAVLGPRGVIEAVQPNTLIIETTTSTPGVTRKLAKQLAVHGAEIVDAPVSRGVPAAENGTLSIMLGGERTAVDRALPILTMFGTDIVRTGALGSGHIAKALNMGVLGVNFIAMAEIMALGLAVGLDRTRLADEIERSEAASFVSANHYPKYVLTERYNSRFTLGLMRKDVGIAALIAAETGLPRPYLHRVVDFYDEVTPSQPDVDNTLLFPEVETWFGPRSRDDLAIQETFLADLLTTLAATTLFGTREFVTIAETSGVTASDFLEVLRTSSGDSRIIETRLSRTPFQQILQRSSVAFKTAATRVFEIALKQSVPMPLIGLTRDILSKRFNNDDGKVIQKEGS